MTSEGVRGRRGHKSLKVAVKRSSLKVVVSGLRSSAKGAQQRALKDWSSRQRRHKHLSAGRNMFWSNSSSQFLGKKENRDQHFPFLCYKEGKHARLLHLVGSCEDPHTCIWAHVYSLTHTEVGGEGRREGDSDPNKSSISGKVRML